MTAAVIDIWSDIHCPWALIAVHRLRAARQAGGFDVAFAPRAWPLEWVNGHGTPHAIVTTETAALAGHEPDLFNRYSSDSWPSTLLPAFELVAATARVHDLPVVEDVDYALRLAFFRDGVDISILAGLRSALTLASDLNDTLDVERVLHVWMHDNPRADVAKDFERSREVPIQGSPQIFWPDGSTTHNPGMTDHTWSGDLVRIGATDPLEPARELARQLPARIGSTSSASEARTGASSDGR